jgi:hypothetical protein
LKVLRGGGIDIPGGVKYLGADYNSAFENPAPFISTVKEGKDDFESSGAAAGVQKNTTVDQRVIDEIHAKLDGKLGYDVCRQVSSIERLFNFAM